MEEEGGKFPLVALLVLIVILGAAAVLYLPLKRRLKRTLR
jgi:hypothetical protein